MLPQFHLYLRAGYLHPVAGALAAVAFGAPCWAAFAVLLIGTAVVMAMHA